MIMKKKLIFMLALISALVVTGCGKKTVPEKYAQMMADKSGKIVKLGFYGSPDSVDPIKSPEYTHDQIFSNLIFASPLRKLDDGSYAPYLFESYETSLNDEGQLVLNAKWHENLKWHDGVEFTADEFDYNLKQMASAEKNSPYADACRNIISVKNEEGRVEMVFKDNSVKYLDLLCAGLIPGHLLAEGSKLASGTTEDAYKAFCEEPVGLGPYKLAERDKHKYFVLEPNKYFFDERVASRPTLLIACTYELQQSISDFREGLLDWIDMPAMVGEQLENLGIENVTYVKYPNPAVMAWVFNTKNEKLQDVKVRKALNLILDRECVKSHLGPDCTELLDIPFVSETEQKSASERFEEGIKLLDEAGIVDKNGDGIRDSGEKSFTLKILVNDDNMMRRMIIEKMIENLKKAGIAAEQDVVGWADFVSGRLKTGNFETALLSYHIPFNGSMKGIFGTKTAENTESLNFTGISDAELDKDLELMSSAVCPEAKSDIQKRINKRISELCPCAFLVRPHNLGLVHSEKINKTEAACSYWNDIYNWKLMFGSPDSSL